MELYTYWMKCEENPRCYEYRIKRIKIKIKEDDSAVCIKVTGGTKKTMTSSLWSPDFVLFLESNS